MGSISDIIAQGPRPTNWGINTPEQTQAAQLGNQNIAAQIAQHKLMTQQQAALGPEQLKAAQIANQQAELQRQQLEAHVGDNAIIQMGIKKHKGNYAAMIADPEILSQLKDANTAPALAGLIAKNNDTLADTAKKQAEAAAKQADVTQVHVEHVANLANNILQSGATPAAASLTIDQARKLHPEWAKDYDAFQQIINENQDPEKLKQILGQMVGAAGPVFAEKQAKASAEAQKLAVAQTSQDASILAAAANLGPSQLAQAMAQLPAERQRPFAGIMKPEEILAVGAGPKEALTYQNDVNKLAEEKNWHAIQEKYETAKTDAQKQSNAIAAGHLALQNKEFQFKFGDTSSRAAFTDSVIKNPDSYFSLPADLKFGVANDLVSRGLSVPTQLPSELKNRAVSAGLTLSAVQRIQALLDNPLLKDSVGKIAGRLGNVEQAVGDTFFKDPERSKLEQQLRSEFAYLKFQEAKGLMGGRPVASMTEQLGRATGDATRSREMINGALAAVANNMKSVGQETRDYSFGGAGGAAAGGGPAKVKLRAPDGSIAEVDPGMVDHYVGLGAKVVK